MIATLLLVNPGPSTPTGYITGAVLSVLILGYLLYSLIKPEKF